MIKRVTVLIDEDLDKKLRILQANFISKTQSSHSFSKVINDVLRKSLK